MPAEIRRTSPGVRTTHAEGGEPGGHGKTPVVGMGGEIEHARTLTHTLWFGIRYRDTVKTKPHPAFTNARAAAGCPLMNPLTDKDDAGRRSRTIHVNVPDAPADDEIVIASGASVGGNPHCRIGDRDRELMETGRDVCNPAGV